MNSHHENLAMQRAAGLYYRGHIMQRDGRVEFDAARLQCAEEVQRLEEPGTDMDAAAVGALHSHERQNTVDSNSDRMKAIMFLTWAIRNQRREAQVVLDALIRDMGGDPTEQEINRAMLMVDKFARYNSEVFPALEARLK